MTEQDTLCGAKEHAKVKDIQSLTHRDKKDDVPVDHTRADSRQCLCGEIPPRGGMGGKPRKDIETPGDALHGLPACHLAQPAVLDMIVQPVGGVMQALLPGNLSVPIAHLTQEREACLYILRPGKRQRSLDQGHTVKPLQGHRKDFRLGGRADERMREIRSAEQPRRDQPEALTRRSAFAHIGEQLVYQPTIIRRQDRACRWHSFLTADAAFLPDATTVHSIAQA
jgi:hypothetical protein